VICMSVDKMDQLLPDRRNFIAYFAGLGLSSTLFPGVLWAQVQQRSAQKITKEMLIAAERIAGLNFTDAQREMMLLGVNGNLAFYEELRRVNLDVSDVPALRFSPILPGMKFDKRRLPFRPSIVPDLSRPENLEDVAFWSVAQLATLIKTRKVGSVELTEMYLARLKKYDPVLKCAVTITEELARQQARRADAEIAAGKYRGPLHGIPWGAKDLIAKKGYRTTWGAAPFKEQIIDKDATVIKRLEDAGAVLVAKLATGELAYWDEWFGGKTKNPWDTSLGSGGSSAGPASATAAGLVGFAIGTETGGSMVEPAIKCGVTALRPTFGRVSRDGVMPGAWSFDKIGPMCRSVEDCALVLNAVHGTDDLDLSVIDMPFNWDAKAKATNLRIGYLKAAFDEEYSLSEEKTNDFATLDTLREFGFDLKPVKLPDYPIQATSLVAWFGEIGSVWDELVRSGKDALLGVQETDGVGNLSRMTRTVPAVESIRASRIRTLIMRATAKIFDEVDVYVAPFSSADSTPRISGLNLQLTNLTGHPAVALQNGFTRKGTPTGITFIGNLFGEAELLAVAKAYQDATGFHLKHPKMF
jgi:Asp-tRNA(Asn)/Glu-tRNA(Gln) amidotransferase A subunit family amidase